MGIVADAPNQQLEEIVTRCGIGIAVMDTAGRYLQVNDPYCELLGRDRDALLASSIQEATHPDDLPASVDAFIRAIESGKPIVLEQRYIRPDGSSVWANNHVLVERDDSGRPVHVLALTHRLSEGTRSHQSLRESHDDLRLVLDSAAGGLLSMDRAGEVTLCNAGFVRMLGLQSENEVVGRSLHELVHRGPGEEGSHALERCPAYVAARSGTHFHVPDDTFFRQDGTSFPVEYWMRPIVRSGDVRGVIGSFVDLTERKAAENRQQIMNQELAHRVKNTLAMVQAIVSQTLRNTPDRQEAVKSVNQRLIALGNAHTALTRTRWGNASIVDVVEGAIAVHRSRAERIQIEGPRIDLGPKASLAVALALHELSTNAAKYGALSNDLGTVQIGWSVSGGAADARFRMRWQERDGPPVATPSRKGFGSRLIAEAIGADLGAEVNLVYERSGVSWSLEAPLRAMSR